MLLVCPRYVLDLRLTLTPVQACTMFEKGAPSLIRRIHFYRRTALNGFEHIIESLTRIILLVCYRVLGMTTEEGLLGVDAVEGNYLSIDRKGR